MLSDDGRFLNVNAVFFSNNELVSFGNNELVSYSRIFPKIHIVLRRTVVIIGNTILFRMD